MEEANPLLCNRVPAIAALFRFATPSMTLLLSGAVLCLVALAWFEASKRLVSRRT